MFSLFVGAHQFLQMVLDNERPVVVNFFTDKNSKQVCEFYQDVVKTSKMQEKICFVALDVSSAENVEIMERIVEQLHIGSLQMPFFLFFKQKTLMLPPFVASFMAQDVTKLKRDLVTYIEKQFLLSNEVVKNSLSLTPTVALRDVSTQDVLRHCSVPTTFEKFCQLSEKVNQWLTGLRTVSRQEVRALQFAHR
jgi:hypothetical protein